MWRTSSLILIIVFCLTASTGFAETITIGAENDWAPYAKADGTGMANDLVKAAFKAQGIEVTFQVEAYNRILELTKRGKILGCFNVPLDQEVKANFLLGNTPLYQAQSSYYQAKDKPLACTAKEELKNGEKVGIVRGYGYGQFFINNNQIEKIEVKSDLLNLKKLSANRIDTTIIYEKVANLLIKENTLEGKIQKAFDSESVDIYLAFSKTFPKAAYYAEQLDQGLAKIKADGTYDRILKAY